MTIRDIMDVGGATDSDLTRNTLKVFILKVYTRCTCDSSNKPIFLRIAASCEFQCLLPISSSKGLNLNSMNYKIYHLLSNTRNFSISRICCELQLIFRNGSEIKQSKLCSHVVRLDFRVLLTHYSSCKSML
jgi:hypothetical protein